MAPSISVLKLGGPLRGPLNGSVKKRTNYKQKSAKHLCKEELCSNTPLCNPDLPHLPENCPYDLCMNPKCIERPTPLVHIKKKCPYSACDLTPHCNGKHEKQKCPFVCCDCNMENHNRLTCYNGQCLGCGIHGHCLPDCNSSPCFSCNEIGHTRKSCPKLLAKKNNTLSKVFGTANCTTSSTSSTMLANPNNQNYWGGHNYWAMDSKIMDQIISTIYDPKNITSSD